LPLKAFTKDHDIKLARDLIPADRADIFYCPICADRFRIVVPTKTLRIKHFRHINGHYHGEPETTEHIQLKECVFNESVSMGFNSDLEHPINLERDYIADVLVTSDKNTSKIAVECQCSPASLDYVVSKTLYYVANNFIPLWILGVRWFDNAYFSKQHNRGYFIQKITGIEKWLVANNFPIYYSNGEEEFYRFNSFKYRMASHGQQMNGQLLSSYLGWFSISKITFAEMLQQIICHPN
jgi:competence CoiA-like predicted nuclease